MDNVNVLIQFTYFHLEYMALHNKKRPALILQADLSGIFGKWILNYSFDFS